MSSSLNEVNEGDNLKIGDIFHAYRSYGGSGHSLGLFIVTSLGTKFVSLKGIETIALEEKQSISDPAYSESKCKCKAKLPIVYNNNEKFRFSYKSYDVKEKQALQNDGGSMCFITFSLIEPDENNNFIYISSHTLYG